VQLVQIGAHRLQQLPHSPLEEAGFEPRSHMRWSPQPVYLNSGNFFSSVRI
jgi:hypothetical protein